MDQSLENLSSAVVDNFVGLNDFVVDFAPEVEKFFIERIGNEEYYNICKKSCQAPP